MFIDCLSNHLTNIKKGRQLSMVPVHKYSTTWNVSLLDFRVRNGNG